MYTLINTLNLKKEGREIYSYLEGVLKHPFYGSAEKRNIMLKNNHFQILWESLSEYQKKHHKDRIPFFGHDIVRSKNWLIERGSN